MATTVLPAYHDDVVTRNMSVGLGLKFSLDGTTRKIVFTGDSGLYPRKINSLGEYKYYDSNKKDPKLDTEEGKALYDQYPDEFKENVDLMIVHIGSIKKQEFTRPPKLLKEQDEGKWYYPNHLGLLGTLIMLHQTKPKTALISEFGSELKGFHIELVGKIKQALRDLQKGDNPNEKKSFVVPGDLTIIYGIEKGKFFCHQTVKFEDHAKLQYRTARHCSAKWDEGTKRYKAEKKPGKRVYLFKDEDAKDYLDNRYAEKFCEAYFNRKLPIYNEL